MAEDEQERAQREADDDATMHRARMQAAIVNALDAANAWTAPRLMAEAQSRVFACTLIGLLKLDPRHIPWVVTVVDALNRDVAEAVCAIAPPTDTQH